MMSLTLSIDLVSNIYYWWTCEECTSCVLCDIRTCLCVCICPPVYVRERKRWGDGRGGERGEGWEEERAFICLSVDQLPLSLSLFPVIHWTPVVLQHAVGALGLAGLVNQLGVSAKEASSLEFHCQSSLFHY